jgi:hypothetical protein
MSSPTTLLRYGRGDTGADGLQAVVDGVLAELANGAGPATDSARAAGLDPRQLTDVDVRIEEGGQGAEPILTTIVVGITVSAGSKVAQTLWTDVIWPRVVRRLGVRALGEPKRSGV